MVLFSMINLRTFCSLIRIPFDLFVFDTFLFICILKSIFLFDIDDKHDKHGIYNHFDFQFTYLPPVTR